MCVKSAGEGAQPVVIPFPEGGTLYALLTYSAHTYTQAHTNKTNIQK